MNNAVKTLTKNIKAAIAAAKKAGTCGMSVACLKANTPTAGLSCDVATYHAAFAAAVKSIKVKGFAIYG
jgi:hypothetical protein